MKKNHPQICLYQPEIPQNTGNIGRISAATHSRMHIILPTGFTLHDKNLRRSGLDYWPFLDLEIHPHIDDLIANYQPNELAFMSVRGKKSYLQIPPENKIIIFGRETKGLPPEIHEKYSDCMYRLPIFNENVRSLNLANSVAIVVYSRLQRLYPPEKFL